MICVPLWYVFPRTRITSDMCFPGRETQNTEVMHTRRSIRIYLLSTSLYCHLLQLFSCHPLKECYKKISILCNIRNNSGVLVRVWTKWRHAGDTTYHHKVCRWVILLLFCMIFAEWILMNHWYKRSRYIHVLQIFLVSLYAPLFFQLERELEIWLNLWNSTMSASFVV